ncbi:MAG: TrmH family RNA methyltransferase [Synechococcus sp.]|uniref:TrmH family RNA methyltransferase n=1 Tax=Synechococcus sp. BMK-MC-1 TaxID=1442551 RepID=UPI001645A98E|nr:RNA methyltransferase [Synechococcus sp. BMK-MC-1]QNI68145.1 RNA methyltransferase/ TrmH family [Synechococcus sp. BMK-MC-1]
MPVIAGAEGAPISSRRNPLIKRIRALQSKAGRESEQCVLLEGTHQVQELLAQGEAWTDPLAVLATPLWLQRHRDLLAQLPGPVQVQLMTPEALGAALTTVHPDGVACLWPLKSLPAAGPLPNFVLALDRLQDPGNVGTLLRTALAADVEQVWMGAGADPLGSKVVRSAAGALLSLPYRRFGPTDAQGVEQLATALKDARARGLQVVATLVPDAAAGLPVQPYWQLDWCRPTVLVLGNEGAGLHPQLLGCCSHGVTLPHGRKVESLNVAAAAVPLLLERRRATMTAPMQQSG